MSSTPARVLDRSDLAAARRIVVKVGSGVVARDGRMRTAVIRRLAADVAEARAGGREIVMVVSGSVAAGCGPLGLAKAPKAVLERQVVASVGQPLLMARLAEAFAPYKTLTAQLLMSADDIENRRRFMSARHTMLGLLARGVIPIINENDALSEHEAIIGDNDHLAALVTSVISADWLIILSTARGVMEQAGAGPLISRVEVGSRLDAHIDQSLSATGVGGMRAKVAAAHLASQWGVPTLIAEGRGGALPRILAGRDIGTLFVPDKRALPARKRWIAIRSRSRGQIIVDDGARRALTERGASLLPAGITDVRGDFPMGARVDICTPDGVSFAVGLVSYGSDEIRRVKGRKQSEIAGILGYEYYREIVHRDDLVLLSEKT
ncbi:MAG: glutamate 5-kinase [Phycisphaerales bacterium]|nr:glutamate 5-kinase [Phycisphaerales bacterium]